MTDFFEKFRVLAGLTNQFAGFDSEPLEKQVTEMQVPAAEAAGFAAEERISKEQQKAIKLVAAEVGDTRPTGDYWQMSVRVPIGEGAVHAGMSVTFHPKPGALFIQWSGSPAWKDEKNELAVSTMRHVLGDFERELNKYGDVERDFQEERQFMNIHVHMPVAMTDLYVAELPKLARRFGKLVRKYADMANTVEMEAISPDDIEVVMVEKLDLKTVEEGMAVQGTMRKRKDGMYRATGDGRWLKVKKSNANLKAGQAKMAAQRAAFKAAYPHGEGLSPIAARMQALLGEQQIEEGSWGEMVGMLKDLRAGDKVEITYLDGYSQAKTTREISMSWEDMKGQSKSDAFKNPTVMLKAKVKGKFKEGMIKDYGSGRILWQPTMNKQVTDVVDIKKL